VSVRRARETVKGVKGRDPLESKQLQAQRGGKCS
jgi:hypothetical protein